MDVKKVKCETCGYVQDATGFGDVMPPCPECGDTSHWVVMNMPPVELGEPAKKAADHAMDQARETGFEDIVPASPEVGDMSTVALNSIKPVNDDGEAPKREPGEPNKETGFEDIVPASPESGDMSTVALNSIKPVDDDGEAPKREPGEPNKESGFEDIVPASPESGDMSTVALNSIKPVNDEPVVRKKQEYKCKNCGETVSAYGDELPPCPECGGISNWVLATLGVGNQQ